MNFGFVTCVELGLSCMEEVYRIGGRLDLAVTLPDDRSRSKSGRVYLDDFCTQRHIPLLKVPNVNADEVIEAIRVKEIDWLFIIGWSQIAGTAVLEAPARGALGIHPTLLPEGRGRAAIPWAILKGLKRSGVTLFKLDEGVDTGPILAQDVLHLTSDETAGSLYERVCDSHRSLIARVWPDLVSGHVALEAQDGEKASYWPGRSPEDGRIDPVNMTVEEVERLVRAVTRPYPGAFIDQVPSGRRIRIWEGRIGDPEESTGDSYEIRANNGRYLATNFTFETP